MLRIISDVNEEKGIPNFWMHLLENRTFLPEQIQVYCYISERFVTNFLSLFSSYLCFT